jgi:putative endonuclease
MPNFRRVGAAAEDRAAEFLIERGYTIVTRRWSARGGELDIVALDEDILVFVEVKARSGRWGTPEDAIDSVKIARFLAAIQAYCVATDQNDRPVRYDVIAIDDKGLRHYEDAFRA